MAPWQLSSLMKGDKSRVIFSTFDLLVFMFVETVRYVSQDACILFTAANRYLLFILDPVGIVLDQTWKKVNLIFILALLLPFLKESYSVLSSWFQGGYYNFGSDFPIPQGPQTFVFVSGVVSVSPGRVLRPSTDACYWDPLELFETQQSYTCSHWGWRRDTVDGSQIRLSSWFGRHPIFLQRFFFPQTEIYI